MKNYEECAYLFETLLRFCKDNGYEMVDIAFDSDSATVFVDGDYYRRVEYDYGVNSWL